MRFLQFSDLHFGSRLTGGRLALPPVKRDQREREFRAVVDTIVAQANEHDVDAVLVPGDVFDDESVGTDAVAFLIDRFNQLAPVPVFVAAGNHDPIGPASHWNRGFLSNRHRTVWGDHVHVFPADRWELIDLRGGIRIAGRSWGAGSAGRRLVEPEIPGPRDGCTVVVAHGSDETRMPPGKSAAFPFSADDLAAARPAYAAIGHFHRHAEIRDSEGRLAGAYAGSPVARGLDETGPRGVLLVEIGPPPDAPQVAFIGTDPRQIHVLEADLTGVAHSEAARDRIVDVVRAAAPSGEDLVYVRARGLLPPELEVSAEAIERDPPAYHIEVDLTSLRPDYDLEAILEEDPANVTVEARFIRTLQEAADRESDPDQRSTIESAVYAGLDALRTGKVRLRRVD